MIQFRLRREILLGVAFYLGFIPLLSLLPYWFPVDPTVLSVASTAGYDVRAAYVFLLFWSLTGVALFTLAQRHGFFRDEDSIVQGTENQQFLETRKTVKVMEVIAVVVLIAILYFPFYLSKYGPYIEDNAFLTMLHRMNSGQRPYVDFEFLYGPLMIYPLFFWMKWFGYSMSSYYAFIAILEILLYCTLLRILRNYFSDFRSRLAVFFVIGAFHFNAVLGPNYNGFRRLIPVMILLFLARNPKSNRLLIVVSLSVGLFFAYSLEFATACLLAIVAMYGFLWIKERNPFYALKALIVPALSIMVWAVSSQLILGETTPDYFDSVSRSLHRFAAGEQGFPFRWTINYLAIFALFSLSLIIIGRGLGRSRKTKLESGDLLLLGGSIYSLVALRAGLNRSDIWHLTPSFMVLIFTFMLPIPTRVFAISKSTRALARSLIVIMAITYLFSLSSFGSYYMRGLIRGMRDTGRTNRNTEESVSLKTRVPSIEMERSHPDPDVIQLGNYLGSPERAHQPVVFYSHAWFLDKRVGVNSKIYIPDDFMMSEENGLAIRKFVDQEKDVIVVMELPAYNYLFHRSAPAEYSMYLNRMPVMGVKSISVWLSTPFFRYVNLEWRLKEERWKRTVGVYIREKFHKVQRFGYLVALERL